MIAYAGFSLGVRVLPVLILTHILHYWCPFKLSCFVQPHNLSASIFISLSFITALHITNTHVQSFLVYLPYHHCQGGMFVPYDNLIPAGTRPSTQVTLDPTNHCSALEALSTTKSWCCFILVVSRSLCSNAADEVMLTSHILIQRCMQLYRHTPSTRIMRYNHFTPRYSVSHLDRKTQNLWLHSSL